MNSWSPGPPGYPPNAPYMHHMPYGAPAKEEVYPFGGAMKIDPEGPDVKYMSPGGQKIYPEGPDVKYESPGGQVKQEADLKPPMLQEEGDRMAFADQSSRKRRWGPPFKDEDPSNPKRSRFEEEHFDAQPQDDSDQSCVTLDTYNSDLSLKIDDSHLSASPLPGVCFAYMWHGVRATFGFTRGRVCFEVTLEQNIPMPEMELAERHPHVLRIGWSLDECGYTLGEEPFSWGYGGTGKASTNLKFKDYGCQFKAGDVVGAFLDLDMEPAVMSFTVNGNHQGIAYELRKFELKGRPIFPHILTKNIRFSVNFGDSPQPMASVLPGYTFVGKVPLAVRVQGSVGPASKKDCEALMMIGLPASGKTTWVHKYKSENRHMKYNVLGSNDLLDKMKVDGLARKRNYSGRWDQLIKACMDGLNGLLKMAYQTPRNYIIDQTNVYQTARKRKMKGFWGCRRRAIVMCPKDEDLKARTAKREREEGKDVPDEAVDEMKANFSLPNESEPFDCIEYIELSEMEARSLVQQYNEEARAKKGGSQRIEGFQRGRGRGRGRGWDHNRSADSFNPAGASEFNRGGSASNRGRGLEGFARGGRGSSSSDRGGGFGRGGGPDRFSRGGGPDGFGRGSDSFSRGGGSDRHSRGGGGDSHLNDFTQRGRGGFDKHVKRGGFNQDIAHSSVNHDASEDVLSVDGPDCFNRGGVGGIAGFGRGRDFSNSSSGQVSDRFGIGRAPEDNNRPIATDHYSRGGGSDRYSRGSVPDNIIRDGGADTYGRGGGPETYGRDSAPDCYGHGGAGGSDAYGRGNSDTYGRGGGVDSCSRSGGSDSYGRGGRSDSYGQGDGFNSYNRGGGSDSYSRGGGSDSYSRGGGSDTYSRGGGSDSSSRGGGSDTYSRGGGSDSYNRGGRSDSYDCDGGSVSYGRGGRFDSCDRGGGPNTHDRRGSDSHSGGATRFARDGDAAGTSLEFKPNDFNPVGYPYNRDSQGGGFSQDRSAGLGDANGRGSSSFNRGDYGNRAGGYGNAADVDKYHQSSEYRAPCPASSSWEAKAPPPALGRGDALAWKASPPPSAPVSRDWSAAPGYSPPTPQQQVWSSQPQGYGGYQA